MNTQYLKGLQTGLSRFMPKPLDVRQRAIEKITSLVAQGGTLLVATYLRPEPDTNPDGPPWPLTMKELSKFETLGLTLIKQQTFTKRASRFCQRVQLEYCFT
ncbi:MAG: hypothetical protein AAGI69_23615 [Cyanobacteria bacterium P01_H01_bin.21]